jgi:hypothetical protein
MHGDNDPRFAGCACTPCSLTRNFAAFRDSAPPDRPSEITDRHQAAAFMLWLSWQLGATIDDADDED